MAKRFLRFPTTLSTQSHSYGKYQVHHHRRHQGAKGQDSFEEKGQTGTARRGTNAYRRIMLEIIEINTWPALPLAWNS